MSAKHTPGPWLLEHNLGTDDLDCGWSVLEREQKPYRGDVCRVTDAEHIDGITKGERDANARLIAASPDLLEAANLLMGAASTHMTYRNANERAAYEALRAAITKATGEQA